MHNNISNVIIIRIIRFLAAFILKWVVSGGRGATSPLTLLPF